MSFTIYFLVCLLTVTVAQTYLEYLQECLPTILENYHVENVINGTYSISPIENRAIDLNGTDKALHECIKHVHPNMTAVFFGGNSEYMKTVVESDEGEGDEPIWEMTDDNGNVIDQTGVGKRVGDRFDVFPRVSTGHEKDAMWNLGFKLEDIHHGNLAI